MTRRRLLAKSTAITAFPYVLTSNALARPGRPGANDRIITGHIGVGGMGRHHLGEAPKEDVAAICDVDATHLKKAADIVGGDVDLHTDYRRVLERKDIDAVIIASPDHWHAIQMVNACQAGKDVYCEKPASRTIREGQAMIRAARRYGRVVQIGSQGRSTEAAYKAAQFIRNGEIGQIERVVCWHYPNPVGKWKPNTEPPAHLDWDFWLGPARWMPYNEDKCHFNFRWLMDFGGGQIRDRGAHVFSVVMYCLDLDHAGPVTIEASGEPPHDGPWDCPVTMDVRYQFRNPDWTLIWSQPGEKASDASFGAKYWGTRDTLVVNGGDGGCDTEAKAMNYEPPSGGKGLFRSPGHKQHWYDCIRTRELPCMDIAVGHRIATLCNLGNLAYRLGRKLTWDPDREMVINDVEANRLLGDPARGPWHL